MKKIRIILIILIIILIPFSTLFMPFSFANAKGSDDYSHVMCDNITNKDAKVTSIAMLGAHDAFSNGINKSSLPNTNESGIYTNNIVNTLAKGLVVRMSKAQVASASEMLKAGVRYFDVRCTKIDNKYYACHGYLSYELDYYIKDIVDFLGENDGEFIIFDLQHFYTSTATNYDISNQEYIDLLNYLNQYKNAKGLSFLDYIHYDSSVDALSNLTYQKVVSTNAGIIMLAKVSKLTDTYPLTCIYKRDGDALKDGGEYESVRSFWHNTNDTNELINGIDEEYDLVKEKKYSGIFIINQAQETGFFTNLKIIRSLFSWSIIDMANFSNKALVSDEERFVKWLDAMPIVMVDYCTSKKGDFNKLANEYIIKKNKSL